MYHSLKTKTFIVILAIFLATNSVLVSNVKASDLALSLKEVAAAGSATALLGSSALGIAVPIVVAVAAAWAGYEIYQNREQIWGAFKSWYESASNTVREWMNHFQSLWDSGAVTDGSTISIPQGVLQEAKQFISDYKVEMDNSNTQVLASPTVSLITAGTYVENATLKQYIQANYSDTDTYSYASPILVLRDLVNQAEFVMKCPYVSPSNNIGDTLLINYNVNLGVSFTWQAINALSDTTIIPGFPINQIIWSGVQFDGGIYSNLTNYNTWSSLPLDQWEGFEHLNTNIPELVINGNTITGEKWRYEFDIIIPNGASVALVNEGYDGNTFTKQDLQYLVNNGTAVGAINPLAPTDRVYNPSIETTGAHTGELVIELTTDVVKGLDKYLVKERDKTTEADFIRTIDLPGTGEVVVNPPGWLEGLFDGLWEGLKNLLEWLFVPSDAKVDEFVSAMEAKLDKQCGILTYPLALVIKFLMGVLSLGVSDCILMIPRISFQGHQLYEGLDFNFTEFISQPSFRELYSIYITITDFIMIIAVINLAIKKGDEIIRGN